MEDEDAQEPRPRRLSRRRFITNTAVAVPGIAALGAATASPAPGPSVSPPGTPVPGGAPPAQPTDATYLVEVADPELPNAVVVGEPVPRLYVNALSGGATDTDPYRGSIWQPYATLEQALSELSGVAGSYSNLIGITNGARWAVDVDIGPGPPTHFPAIPKGGYPGNQTFNGQAHRLTKPWRIPPFVGLYGHGAAVHGFRTAQDGGAPGRKVPRGPGYNTLIYGDVPNDSLLQIGSPQASRDSPCYMEGFALCNVGNHGVGLKVLTDQPGTVLRSIHAYGCAGWGMQFQTAGDDTMTLITPQIESCGQDDISGGLQIGVGAIPTQALIFIGAAVRNNQNCDIQVSGNKDPVGVDGGATVFIVPRLGTSGVLLQGAKGIEFWSPYTETTKVPTNNAVFTLDFLGGSNEIVDASFGGGTATITTVRPHGFLKGEDISVIGMKPSGYNVYNATVANVVSATQLTYSLPSNPGNFVAGGALVANDASDEKTWCRDILIRGPGRIHGVGQEVWLGKPARDLKGNLVTEGSMAEGSTTLTLTIGTLVGDEAGETVRVLNAGNDQGNKDLVSRIVSVGGSTTCTLADPCPTNGGVTHRECTVPPYAPTPYAFWFRAAYGCRVEDVRPIAIIDGDSARYYAVLAPTTTDNCHIDLSHFTNELNAFVPDGFLVGFVDG